MKKQNKPADWRRLYSALGDAIEWALDVAGKLAQPYVEEVEAVERVRWFVRAQLAGEPAEIGVDDLMLTFGILIAAIDRDLLPDDIMLAAPASLPVPAFPDPIPIAVGPELWERTLPRHCPGAHTVFTRRMPHIHYAA